jgi:hypothetical protein
MSIYYSIDSGEPIFLCSNNGWAEACRALRESSLESLIHLADYGWWEGLDEFRSDLVGVIDESEGDTKTTLFQLLTAVDELPDDSVVTINEGFSPENDKPSKGHRGRLKGIHRNGVVKQQGPVAAGLAVVADDTGRVLLLQRQLDEEDHNSGKWELPGGKIDAGEAPLEAACREWTEEVGCSLPEGRLDYNRGENGRSWISGNGKYQGFVYHVTSCWICFC